MQLITAVHTGPFAIAEVTGVAIRAARLCAIDDTHTALVAITAVDAIETLVAGLAGFTTIGAAHALPLAIAVPVVAARVTLRTRHIGGITGGCIRSTSECAYHAFVVALRHTVTARCIGTRYTFADGITHTAGAGCA